MNKKIKKLLVVVMIMFCTVLFAGVTVSSENAQAATNKANKIKKEYNKFVKEFKYAKQMEKGWNNYFSCSTDIRSSYGIADIDSNGIPELIVQSMDESGWACTLVYTYDWKKKKIRTIKFPTEEKTYTSICWSYGGITSYSKKYKCFPYKPLSNICIYSKIKKLKVKNKYILYRESDGNKYTYWVNNKVVSEKKYYKYSKTLKKIKFTSIDILLFTV